MKNKLILVFVAMFIFMIVPNVEAREYDLTQPYINFPSGYGSLTVESGDILKISHAYSVGVYDLSGNLILSGKYYDSVLEYTVLSYEELTGQTLPENKKLVINVKISTVSSLADAVDIRYTLADDIPKEVVYHNTYDAENNNPTSYYVEETDILLSDISRDGYKFLGWYTSPDFEEDTRVTMISSDEPDVLELYARWEKIEEDNVIDSNDEDIFTNPNTSSMFYIVMGIGAILILGTALVIVYKYKKL